jgi:hypothetical protein
MVLHRRCPILNSHVCQEKMHEGESNHMEICIAKLMSSLIADT